MTTQHLERAAVPPADWYPDPVGRHQYRFFDGIRWTDHVADDGRVQFDPLNPVPPPEPTVVIPTDEGPAPQPGRPTTVATTSAQPAGVGRSVEELRIPTPGSPWPESLASTPASLGDGPARTAEAQPAHRLEVGSAEAATAGPATIARPQQVLPPPRAPTPTPPATEWGQEAPVRMFSLDESVGRCLRGYVSFAGRASRSEYWWFALTANLALGVVAFAGVALFGGLIRDPAAASVFGTLPYGLLSLGLLPALLSAAVRRLHDTGRSGTMLLLGLIPLAGPVVLLAFLISPGTPGENRFGPTPTPMGGPPQPVPTIIAAARIPLQYLLVGIASLVTLQFVRFGQVGFWGLWSNRLGGWFLMTLAVATAVAFMLAMRHTIPSRWLLWLEVGTAAVIAAAPLVAGAGPWLDWPELLSAPLLVFGRLLAMAWLGVVLVSAFPRLQATPGSTT